MSDVEFTETRRTCDAQGGGESEACCGRRPQAHFSGLAGRCPDKDKTRVWTYYNYLRGFIRQN